ncbi:PREDICTED: ABC transporter G family member 20-like [Priapulus caudatus]|uniref:ABC transporter G family member 20-like n=1 Tax=Priapulus caudatus TaxID=37621 RepID=A0ABM1E2N4_PRICU|nr:PREDICTED: ABC transporter G family member 20-like [Priapulus caudatus]
MDLQEAVGVHSVFKSYGSGKNKLEVLIGINLTVTRGNIYGLLGPSGCGKTTLLRCLLGRLPFDGGVITTLGKPPLSAGHGVPGRMVGYMPQEVALYNEFTIKETLRYFGRLNDMSMELVAKRTDFLVNFLHLPGDNRMVKTLSGGQKRRVSFCVALLHEPPLLILDEPTVGVDPLLRSSIWQHLIEIVQTGETTIILTTHYIEEARAADMVGLMRHGILLAESPPADLLMVHQSETLEAVFLKLCTEEIPDDPEGDKAEISISAAHRYQSMPQVEVVSPKVDAGGSGIDDERTPLLANHTHPNSISKSLSHSSSTTEVKTEWKSSCSSSLNNIFALIIKDLLKMWRNIPLLVFQFIMPSIQLCFFCLAVGGDLKNVPVAVVNQDSPPILSTSYLKSISSSIVDLQYHDNFADGYNAVLENKAWALLYFNTSFTMDLITRARNPTNATSEIIDGGSVHVYQDITNQQISLSLTQELLSAFETFARNTLYSMGFNPGAADIPIKFEDPVYGDTSLQFTDYMAPGIICTVTFFMAVGLTSLSFITERKEGLLDRSMVAGVTPVEVMIAHICSQFFVLVVQISLLLIVAIGIFKVPHLGSIVLVFLLTLLQGLGGMAYGFLISSLCDEEYSAIQISLASFYPCVLLSGIIWPLEAMPSALRYISIALPQTIPTDAMRGILLRGWGLEYLTVGLGIVVIFGWTIGLLLLSAIVLKIRKI